MKKSFVAACIASAFIGNLAFAYSPSQDKPVSKTVTMSKKTATPVKTTTTKTVHKKHVKKSE